MYVSLYKDKQLRAVCGLVLHQSWTQKQESQKTKLGFKQTGFTCTRVFRYITVSRQARQKVEAKAVVIKQANNSKTGKTDHKVD